MLNGLTFTDMYYLFDIILPLSNVVTVQGLVQIRNLLSFIPEQKVVVTCPFSTVLKNGTRWMLKSEISSSINRIWFFSELMKIHFLMCTTS